MAQQAPYRSQVQAIHTVMQEYESELAKLKRKQEKIIRNFFDKLKGMKIQEIRQMLKSRS